MAAYRPKTREIRQHFPSRCMRLQLARPLLLRPATRLYVSMGLPADMVTTLVLRAFPQSLQLSIWRRAGHRRATGGPQEEAQEAGTHSRHQSRHLESSPEATLTCVPCSPHKHHTHGLFSLKQTLHPSYSFSLSSRSSSTAFCPSQHISFHLSDIHVVPISL